jgi:hypothetical protein
MVHEEMIFFVFVCVVGTLICVVYSAVSVGSEPGHCSIEFYDDSIRYFEFLMKKII